MPKPPRPLDDFAARYALPEAARRELADMLAQAARDQALQQGLPDSTLATIAEPVPQDATLWYLADDSQEVPRPAPVPAGPRMGRFELLGTLGEGGMGRVYRVRDPELDRVVALKVLRPELVLRPGFAERFLTEAQATAALQHPGVVPVHELGRLPDGRVFFTMPEIDGRTLSEVIAAERSPDTAALRRWLEVFRRACETVAYAHSRGVVHRDLKPSNIMVGAFGQVLVVDWGIAEVAGRSLDTMPPGTVLGTPWYMAPEQARGEAHIGAAADTWSLGAVLYQLLMGEAPFSDRAPHEVVLAVAGGEAPPAPSRGPEALRELVRRAMQPEPSARYRDAAELADAISDWLEGVAAQERALAHVAEADRLAEEVEGLRARAAERRAEAAEAAEGLNPWDPEALKAPVWCIEDEAVELEREARQLELRRLETLRLALEARPQLDEAHQRLADHNQRAHAAAEARGDLDAASDAEVGLRAHDRGRWAAYLEGRGALSLRTDPPGAEVELCRYVLRNRRLVAEPLRSLGVTPIEAVELPIGRYLLRLRAEGCEEVRYPVHITRGAHWDGAPPGAGAPVDVPLLPLGSLGPDEVYVPPGWAILGGDPVAYCAPAQRRAWVDGVVFQRFPVTNRQYLRFLNALLDAGQEEKALRWAPRERSWVAAKDGSLLYGRDSAGRFTLVPDAEGDVWHLDWPVVHVGWFCAMAYARWYRALTGQPWRLPGEWEWEKAARGVDGRVYPWGDVIDPSWACVLESHPGRPLPASVHDYPVDESPFGVRGVAGGISDWCAEGWEPDGQPGEWISSAALDAVADAQLGELDVFSADASQTERYRVRRGGMWSASVKVARVAWRNGYNPFLRDAFMGIRLVRSW